MIPDPPNKKNPGASRTAVVWALSVGLISIIIRIGMLLVYQPIAYSDTPSYRRSAEAVLGGFEHYDGTRTPGYPIFLAVTGSDENVWIVQMALGVGITLLLFYIAWKLSGSAFLAAVAGLAHSLNLGQLLFEANLLTETLTTFWVVLTLSGVLLWLLHPEKRSIWLALGLGFTSSFALITRPLFIYLPFWILFFLLAERGDRKKLGRMISFIFPVVLIVGTWVTFIHNRFGDWSLTTMNGFHLVQHTGGFFEYVPDEYAQLRDTYLEYRDRRIAEYGTQANTIWDAIPAMQRASGLGFYELSRTLASISIRLILEHPFLYIKNVVEGWLMFWMAPVYWAPESLRLPLLGAILSPIVTVQRFVLVAGNIFFVITSIFTLVLREKMSFSQNTRRFLWCWLGTIWIASILQALLDHGDNPRFSIPLQSLIGLWVVWTGWEIIQNRSVISHLKPDRYFANHSSNETGAG